MPRVHRVVQGECLHSLAAAYGFGSWKTLYDHPDNEALREARKDPHTLLPGDEVTIPERDEKTVDCAAGQAHRFRVKRPKVWLRMVFKDHEGNAYADKRYKLHVGAEAPQEGTTDGSGLVEQPIPASATDATIELFLNEDHEHGYLFPVRLGHLDPIEAVSGVQARLANLGFKRVQITGIMDDPTVHDLLDFQRMNRLDETGESDDATRTKLKSLHDAQ